MAQPSDFSSTKIVSNNWKSTFPEKFETEKDSDLFLHRILYVFTATVLKFRNILPASAFKQRKITDVESYGDSLFWVLKRETGDKVAERVSRLLFSCKEAIENRYLRSFALVINENEVDPDVVTEAFVATFAYGNKDILKIQDVTGRTLAEMSYQGPENVKHQTLYMIDKIRSICHHMNALSANYRPSFRLSYYDDRTPADYEPKGFNPATNAFRFDSNCVKMDIGRIDTKLHAGVFEIQSIYFEEEEEDSLEEKVDNTLQQIVAKRMGRSFDTSMAVDSSFAITPVTKGDTNGRQQTTKDRDDMERARSVLSMISISSQSPILTEPVKLTEMEVSGEETSDDLQAEVGRKRKSAPTARKLDFKEPSPPKRGRPTRAHNKRKQSYVTEDISHGTSSSSSSALESISGIIQISEDKPVIVKSPPIVRTAFEKQSERLFKENTPPSARG